MEQQAPQTPNMGDPEDVQKNKTMAMVAYIIFFIPLLTDSKNSPFAKYHANQSLLLVLTSIALGIIGTITSIIGIGFIILMLIWPVQIIGIIIGIMNANNGKMAPLPLIGKIATIIK
jgi:uncharacterized membrane protein